MRMWERVAPDAAHALLSRPDVTVTNQDGRKIASFRGLSRTIAGTLFDE